MDTEFSRYLFLCCLFLSVTQSICDLEVTIIKPKANDSCGISTGGPLVQQLTTTITYAGCLFWADNGEKIAYVDRYGSAFGRYTPSDGHFNRMTLPEAKDYTFVFPVANTQELLFVVGVDRRMILVNVTGSGSNLVSTTEDLITITRDRRETISVGRTDSQGRAWISSGSLEGHQVGKVYRINNLEKPVVVYKHLRMGAGMAWSPDDKHFYLVDTVEKVIYKFDFNVTEGTIRNRTTVFDKSDYEGLGGSPYDIAISTDGTLWISLLHGGAVIQFDENTKTILWTIAVPSLDIVSLTFGNLDKKTLYVGTTKHYLRRNSFEPAAGAIFSISGLGVTGQTEADIVIPEQYYS